MPQGIDIQARIAQLQARMQSMRPNFLPQIRSRQPMVQNLRVRVQSAIAQRPMLRQFKLNAAPSEVMQGKTEIAASKLRTEPDSSTPQIGKYRSTT